MKYLFPSNFWQILLLLFIPLILSTPFFALLMKMDFSIEKFVLIYGVIYTFLVVIFFFIISKIKKQPIKHDFLPIKTPTLSLLIGIVICFQIGIHIPLAQFVSSLVFPEKLSQPFHASPLELLGALLLAPILEEFIFRGIILRGLLSRYSSTKAILITGILFGLIHINPTQILGAIILGLFFSWVYYDTKNIGTCILLHFVANCTSIVFEYFVSADRWYFYGVFFVLFIYTAIKLYSKVNKNRLIISSRIFLFL